MGPRPRHLESRFALLVCAPCRSEGQSVRLPTRCPQCEALRARLPSQLSSLRSASRPAPVPLYSLRRAMRSVTQPILFVARRCEFCHAARCRRCDALPDRFRTRSPRCDAPRGRSPDPPSWTRGATRPFVQPVVSSGNHPHPTRRSRPSQHVAGEWPPATCLAAYRRVGCA